MTSKILPELKATAPMRLSPRQPFSFAQTLRFILSPPALLNGRKFAPLLDYFEDGEYRRVTEIGEREVLYGVSEERRGLASRLKVRIRVGPDDRETRAAILSLVERQFSTQLDMAPFYRLAGADPVLRKLSAPFKGMRIPQAVSVYETLISAIIEQQINLSFAHQVKHCLLYTSPSPRDLSTSRMPSSA